MAPGWPRVFWTEASAKPFQLKDVVRCHGAPVLGGLFGVPKHEEFEARESTISFYGWRHGVITDVKPVSTLGSSS